MSPRKCLTTLAVLVAILAPLARAAKDFVLDPKEQRVVHPQSVFQPEVAQQGLTAGECRLSGLAYDRQKSGLFEKKYPKQFLPQGAKIYLFPYNAYTEEVVKLFKQHSLRDAEKSWGTIQAEARLVSVTGRGLPELLPPVRVEVDPQFPKIWKSAVVDSQGQFSFDSLRPGRYYLQSQTFMVARDYLYNEQIGEDVVQTFWSNGEVSTESIPVWATRESTMYHKVELVAVVDLQPGQNLHIELNEDWHDFEAP